MDSLGYVSLTLVANFNRIKHLTNDLDLVKLAALNSPVIEYHVGPDGKDILRTGQGWEQWVMKMDQRFAAAQNDGPAEVHSPPFPHPQTFDTYAPRYPDPTGVAATAPVASTIDQDALAANSVAVGAAHMATTSEMGSAANGWVANGTDGIAAPPTAVALSDQGVIPGSNLPMMDTDGEPDSFPDEQVPSLMVVARHQEFDDAQPSTTPPPAVRTFSNGSLDGHDAASKEPDTTAAHQSGPVTNGTGPDPRYAAGSQEMRERAE